MKRIAFSLLAALGVAAIAPPAQAIVGGPFDNNLFYSDNFDGTYQGTLTAKNISAVMIFSTASNADSLENSSTDMMFPNVGRMVSFYRGRVAISGVDAVPNGNSRKIAAAIFSMGTGSSSTTNFHINGFMDAKFDNIHPSITYKGKADIAAYWRDSATPSTEELDEFTARVRGIKTSSTSSGFWIW